MCNFTIKVYDKTTVESQLTKLQLIELSIDKANNEVRFFLIGREGRTQMIYKNMKNINNIKNLEKDYTF